MARCGDGISLRGTPVTTTAALPCAIYSRVSTDDQVQRMG